MSPRAARVLFYALLLGMVLMPVAAIGEEPPCRREGERISCDNAAFKLLTDSCVQAKADAKACSLKLEDTTKDVAAREVALQACQATLAAVPPPAPPPSATRPLIGYATGVVATLALAVALAVEMPITARAVVGAAGVAGLGVGVVLVVP